MTRALVAAALVLGATVVAASRQLTVSIPSFWDRESLHDYELPLASPQHSPQHVSRDYYYALPERIVYASYPIYHPSREPAGYLESLRQTEPKRVFDPATLVSEADWIQAGRLVFEMPIDYGGPIVDLTMVRDPAWYARHRMPLADGYVLVEPDHREHREERERSTDESGDQILVQKSTLAPALTS